MGDNAVRQEVVVTDIGMPFSSMVWFMVKWAIASIPALIILAMLGGLAWGILISYPNKLRTEAQNRSGSAVSSQASTSTSDASRLSPEQTAYLDKVVVRNVEVTKGDLGVLGVFGEVKNVGDHTLKEVEITIYCLGPDGKPVFEKRYTPVLVTEFSIGDSANPLKPGYGRQFGVKMDDAPSEWNKKVNVKVTGVQFQ